MAHAIDVRISQLAGRQHGVIGAAQLRELSVSRSAVSSRVRTGLMKCVLPRVFAVGPAATELTEQGWRMAAVLACPAGAALHAETAAAQHGLWSRSSGTIHVRTPVARAPLDAPRILFHRGRRSEPPETVLVNRIPTVTVTAACAGLGSTLTPHQVAHVLHEAAYRGELHVPQLSATLDAQLRVPGTGAVRRAIDLFVAGSVGTRSVTEDRLLAAILRLGLVEPLVNQRGATGVQGLECDFVWPHARLVVEVDGRGHERPGARAQDAGRDAALRAAGWRVMRIPADRVWRDLDAVVAGIARALHA